MQNGDGVKLYIILYNHFFITYNDVLVTYQTFCHIFTVLIWTFCWLNSMLPLLYSHHHIHLFSFVFRLALKMEGVSCSETLVECVWNVMAHTQKSDFVFRWNGRVHLNRRGRHFHWLLAAEVCASVVAMLDTPCSKVVWEYWLPTPFASFPFTSPPVCHRVPSGFKHTLPAYKNTTWCKHL